MSETDSLVQRQAELAASVKVLEAELLALAPLDAPKALVELERELGALERVVETLEASVGEGTRTLAAKRDELARVKASREQ